MPIKTEDREAAQNIASDLGARIRQARTARGWTQKQTAQLIELTTQAYARLERGESLPSFPSFIRLCNVFETTPDVLLGFGEDAPGVTNGKKPTERTRLVNQLTMEVEQLDLESIRAIERLARVMWDRQPESTDSGEHLL